jgi:hypothetical protein
MVWLCPIIHPAAILRDNWQKEPAQKIALARVAGHLHGGTEPTPWDINKAPPNSCEFPGLDDLADFYRDTKEGGWDALSHDLENAGPHIICDGMTQLNLNSGEIGRSLCLRFRVRGGGLYWATSKDFERAVGWLWWVLADPTVAKVMHNGITHDVPILEDMGFTVEGRLIDTMIMQHTAYTELQKGLQYVATLYNQAPVWKSLTSDEEDEKG